MPIERKISIIEAMKRLCLLLAFSIGIISIISDLRLGVPQPIAAQETYIVVAQDDLSETLTNTLIFRFGIETDQRNLFTYQRNRNATLQDLCEGNIQLLATTTPPSAAAFENCPDVIELMVALDGAVIITANDNDFLACLTPQHLRAIYGNFSPSKRNWQDIDPTFPERPLSVYIPDYYPDTIRTFNQRVLGDVEPRQEIFYLYNNPFGMINVRPSTVGYIPLHLYFEFPEMFRAVSLFTITNNDCVLPTIRNLATGDYFTGARIFWYVHRSVVTQQPMQDLMAFIFTPNEQQTITADGGILPPEELRRLSIANFQQAFTGNHLSGNLPPDFEIKLSWDAAYDLDLGVYLPNGTQVDFETLAQAGFYRLADRGNEHCAVLDEHPEEQVIALQGSAYPTDYLAFVQLSLRCGTPSVSVPYTLEFIINGEVVEKTEGTVVSHQPPPITIFSYPETPSP